MLNFDCKVTSPLMCHECEHTILLSCALRVFLPLLIGILRGLSLILAVPRHRDYLVVCVPTVPRLSVLDFPTLYFFAPSIQLAEVYYEECVYPGRDQAPEYFLYLRCLGLFPHISQLHLVSYKISLSNLMVVNP